VRNLHVLVELNTEMLYISAQYSMKISC